VLNQEDDRCGTLYVKFGRSSIAPEKLLRALLLQAIYSIRSERQLMEQLDYNILFRWFVGLGMDDAVWSPTTFTKNRDRLLDGDVAKAFFEAILIHADGVQIPDGHDPAVALAGEEIPREHASFPVLTVAASVRTNPV
jgi:hypothetical protein